MTDWAVLSLFGAAAVFAVLTVLLPRGRALWALLAAACTAAGVLAGLARGAALDRLLSPVLAVGAAGMAALLWGRGERR